MLASEKIVKRVANKKKNYMTPMCYLNQKYCQKSLRPIVTYMCVKNLYIYIYF